MIGGLDKVENHQCLYSSGFGYFCWAGKILEEDGECGNGSVLVIE